MLSSVILLSLVLATIIAFVLTRKNSRKRRLLLPPGPSGLPFVGNVLEFPQSHYGPSFSKLAEKYGDLVYLNLLGQPVVVVNSHQVAVDLLEKRSANYSGRPRSIMAELTEYDDWVSVLMQYGQKWRAHRRAISQSLHPDVLESAKPTLTKATHDFLQDLLCAPERFSDHIGFAFAKATMRLIYGLQLTDPDDKFFQMANTIVRVGSAMATPGAFLVDTFPILRHVPPWFPGAGFKRTEENWRLQTRLYRDQLFDAGRATVERGVVDSLVGQVLEQTALDSRSPSDLSEVEDMCRGAAATAYAGGADTTDAVVHVFFLAMALHPGAQVKAQEELDAIIGPDRLPTFVDREALPYTNALIKEVLRWHVISPMGVAHRSVEDDIYNGYLIPAGTLVIPNQWAMGREEAVYTDPDCFRPERFLRDGKIDPNVRDPSSFVFGFGRRICPGLHLVDISLFITFASILHVFRISPPLDKDGNPLPLKAQFVETSLTARPEPFPCTVEPRWSQAAQLIMSLSEGV